MNNLAVIERDPLGRIHDLAKYLREPAWTEEGIRLVGAQIQEHVAQAREQHRGAVSRVAALERALADVIEGETADEGTPQWYALRNARALLEDPPVAIPPRRAVS